MGLGASSISSEESLKTAIVKIHRAPPNGDRPLQFFPDGNHNAAWAVEQAGVLWGSGELKDSKGVVIISNPMWHLKAGEYSYEIGERDGEAIAIFEEQRDKDHPTAACKAFALASFADAEHAMKYFGFQVVNGHEVETLPQPRLGTPECKPFPFWKYANEQSAAKAFAEYHKLQLQKMGVLMGQNGFWLPNTCGIHSERILLQLNVGDRRYRGGIDCSLAPDRHLDLHRLIRVGFLHKQSQQDSDTYLAANGQQGGSDEASKAIPLSHNYPQAAMAMLAAVAVNDLPLDLVMTDGKEYILYRFRNNRLLEYDNLSGRQAYFAIAEGLRHHEQLKSSGGFLSNELLGSIDPSMREAHLILKRRNANPWYGQCACWVRGDLDMPERLTYLYVVATRSQRP